MIKLGVFARESMGQFASKWYFVFSGQAGELIVSSRAELEVGKHFETSVKKSTIRTFLYRQAETAFPGEEPKRRSTIMLTVKTSNTCFYDATSITFLYGA